MSHMPASDNQAGVPASISAQFTLYFDGRFWVGVLELHERCRGADSNDQVGAVRVARRWMGASGLPPWRPAGQRAWGWGDEPTMNPPAGRPVPQETLRRGQ